MTDLEETEFLVSVIASVLYLLYADEFHLERRMEDKYLWTISRWMG